MIHIGVISLGCSKNRVDTELMLGKLKMSMPVSFVSEPEDADIMIINTCGFIESAKQESINTILEMAVFKKTAHLKGLIVAGCLSERYRDELIEVLPEVDAFIGVHGFASIADAVNAVLHQNKFRNFDIPAFNPDYLARLLTTAPYSAYVKIAEGCNNRCSYCAIPAIRGPLVSRRLEDIREEVEHLVKAGASEIILVAQDTTKYGLDLYKKPALCDLLHLIAPIDGLKWLRILYCYPENITEELIDTMTQYDNIVKYIDMPVQHFDDRILKRMNRINTCKSIRNTVHLIRKKSADFVLRTTLIVGFPGETEDDFELLKKNVQDLQFDRLGVFAYSPEEGTKAAEFKDQIEEAVKLKRQSEIMALQQRISLKSNKRRIGHVYEVLVEGFDASSGRYFGRTGEQAPEIDGITYIRSKKLLEIGQYCFIKIVDASEYDLVGELME